MAEEVVLVDVIERVRAERTRRRARARVAALAAAVAAVLAVTGLRVLSAGDSSDAPATERLPKVVDLSRAPVRGITAARMLLGPSDGPWAVDGRGQWVRTRITGLPKQARLSADGRTMTYTTGRSPTEGVVHLDGLDGRRRTVGYRLEGPSFVRSTALSPDGRTVAVLLGDVPAAGARGVVQLVGVSPGAPARSIALPGFYGRPVGSFAADGRSLTVLSNEPASTTPAVTVGSVDLTGAREIPRRAVPDTSLRHGWAVSPDGRQVVLGEASPTAVSGTRRWVVVSSATGEVEREFSRPERDELLAWTPDGALVWLRLLPWGPSNELIPESHVLASPSRGVDTPDRTLYVLRVPQPPPGPGPVLDPEGSAWQAAYASGMSALTR